MTEGEEIAARVANGIRVIASIAAVESRVMPYATFVAGFFPGMASILAAVQIAQPWIDKAIAAAPAIEAGIEAGAPILDAINNAGPQVLTHIKTAYAIMVNADPARPEEGLTADDIPDMDAVAITAPMVLGRQWTDEETQRWFDRATGTIGG